MDNLLYHTADIGHYVEFLKISSQKLLKGVVATQNITKLQNITVLLYFALIKFSRGERDNFPQILVATSISKKAVYN